MPVASLTICSLAKAGSAIGSRRRDGFAAPRAGGPIGTGAVARTVMRPTAPVSPSTYQRPSSPNRTPDFGGSAGGTPLAKARSSPAINMRPLAPQRARPDRMARSRNGSNPSAGTPTRLVSTPPSKRARSWAALFAFASARILCGVVAATRPLRSPTMAVVTKQENGAMPGDTSNARRWASGVPPAASESMKLFCTGRRKAGNRSSAANPAAARWMQAGARHEQRLSNTVPCPAARGVRRAVRRTPRSSTFPVIVSPSRATSTAPISTRLRPRVSTRDSNSRPRSSDE